MTSITLPLKKFPGQKQHFPTFFGGRLLVAPLILLLTVPFNMYLYYSLCSNSILSYNLVGLLPYLWGSISIAHCIKKSINAAEKLFEADLNESRQIFERNKNDFRRILFLNILLFIVYVISISYSFILYNKLSLFIISIMSITSVEIALASFFLNVFNVKQMLAYICFVCVSEAALLLLTLQSSWVFGIIIQVEGLLSFLSCLHQVEVYDLQKFIQRMIK